MIAVGSAATAQAMSGAGKGNNRRSTGGQEASVSRSSSGSYSYSSSGLEPAQGEARVLTFADEHDNKLCRYHWYKDPLDNSPPDIYGHHDKKECCVIL
mmetsp:Transcript_460/g.622  ORF Transcript_460/g.622 Transcript_460/m.622 type:complete len:98 (-) Transcript_460:106-399(-)